jgi:hypothetical protein
MARILVSGRGTASLIGQLREGLGDDWMVLDGPHLEGFGPVDAIVLHERQGAAVVEAFRHGAAAPAEAVSAFRHMLDSHGITRALGGYLPIVGLALDPERARDPAGALRAAFLAEPVIGVRIGWTQRIAALFEAIAPAPAPEPQPSRAAESPRLHVDREDAWRVSREAKGVASPVGIAVTPEEHVVPAETVREGGAVLWTGMLLAIVMLGAVLAGMAVLSYGNGPGSAAPMAQTR